MSPRPLTEDRFVPARSADGAGRGDQRREALLTVLHEALRTRRLDDISVAELSSGAGVSRSAFYFYFDSKASAVQALLADLEQEAYGGADDLADPTENPGVTVRGVLERLADRALEHAHVYRAMVEAKALHPGVRERWDAHREEMAAVIAAYIDEHRATGEIVPGPEARILAAMLIQANESALEHLVHGSDTGRDEVLDTAAFLWTQAFYGRSDSHPTRPEGTP